MSVNSTPPRDAMNRFLRDKAADSADKTVRNYRTTLSGFCDFLDDQPIDTLDQLTSNDIQQFKEKRLSEVAVVTCRQDMMVVKQFLRFAAHIDAVEHDLAEMVRIPDTDPEDEICDDLLSPDEAEAVLEHLDTYQYAKPRHVALQLLWKTGMRVSGLYALDLGDFDRERPALELRSRPGTPLKNRGKSERDVIIRRETATMVKDYISEYRHDVTDDRGRDPLITSQQGRLTTSTYQRYCYTATRPCSYSGECPYDGYDPETCDARSWNGASKCPGSVSPHALRRGYVTACRDAGQPRDVTQERTDMSREVLEKHYDKATQRNKAERRAEHLRDV